MKQNTSVEAYLDSYDLVTVEVSRRYYNGQCDSFYISDNQGKVISCKIISNEEHDSFKRYRAQIKEELEFGKEYDLVVNQGYRCSLSFRYIVLTERFDQEFYYEGNLGAIVENDKTIFKLWAPTATKVTLCLMDEYHPMRKEEKGVWKTEVDFDAEGLKYTYLVKVNGEVKQSVDPYGKSSDTNGKNSVVVNTKKLKSKKTEYVHLEKATDAILYELSVRDITMSKESNTQQHGTFEALKERNCQYEGVKTGFDYIKDLGITHVQLMPVNDFFTVDECNRYGQYNWGYDPFQYMALEGSYSSDPDNGLARVNEFMDLVNEFHKENIGVNIDVVFNHMYDVGLSAFDKCVPYYYFRVHQDYSLSNGSFCGNDFESCRKMSRKYILDACEFFIDVYGVDGFRFDLFGILDVDTMNEIDRVVHSINPNAMLYGEGWNLPTALNEDKKCMISNSDQVLNIGFFNDFYRDHLKGKTAEHEKNHRGYLTKDAMMLEAAKFSLCGMAHPDYYHFFKNPTQSINYFECHDNASLWDKMKHCCNDEVREIRVQRQKMMNAVLLLSQGVPFIHCGQEFCRTKNGFDNTYNMPDRINQIDWVRRNRHMDVVEYLKDCIQLRKSCVAFRLSTAQELQKYVSFDTEKEMLIYKLNQVDDICDYKTICVLINPFLQDQLVKYEGYTCILDENGLCHKAADSLRISACSISVLVK